MKSELKNHLLDFYFGAVDDEARLQIERELLLDPEALIDYLDLKRKIESATSVPAEPSPSLWRKLQPRMVARPAVWWSLGAAVAAGLALLLILSSNPRNTEVARPSINHALFDSSSELSVSSGVL